MDREGEGVGECLDDWQDASLPVVGLVVPTYEFAGVTPSATPVMYHALVRLACTHVYSAFPIARDVLPMSSVQSMNTTTTLTTRRGGGV